MYCKKDTMQRKNCRSPIGRFVSGFQDPIFKKIADLEIEYSIRLVSADNKIQKSETKIQKSKRSQNLGLQARRFGM